MGGPAASLIRFLHYSVAGLLLVAGLGYWYVTALETDPATDPKAAQAIALVQTHRAHEAPTLLHALNNRAKNLVKQEKGVRLGEWTVEHIRDGQYLVRVWIREEGFREWFERDYAWRADLEQGRVVPLTDWAAELMPRGQDPARQGS